MITMDLLIPDKVHDESRQGEALLLEPLNGKNNGRKLYIESYGCAMNFSDSEIVASILSEKGFETTSDFNVADVIFINTCSIRENAEQRCTQPLKGIYYRKSPQPGPGGGRAGLYGRTFKSQVFRRGKTG